jgi:hypothetical protein
MPATGSHPKTNQAMTEPNVVHHYERAVKASHKLRVNEHDDRPQNERLAALHAYFFGHVSMLQRDQWIATLPEQAREFMRRQRLI